MQTVYLGHMQLDKIEPLYDQTKQRAMDSRTQATQNGQSIPPILSDLSESPARTGGSLLAAAAGLSLATVAGANALRVSVGSPLPEYLSNTQILDPMCVKHLRTCLPARFHNVDWELLYSTALDGISINTCVLFSPFYLLLTTYKCLQGD